MRIGSIPLTASATGKLPINFESKSPTICSINSLTLKLLKTGICTVVAIQSGNTVFEPVSSVAEISITSTNSKKKQTIYCTNGKNVRRITQINPSCPIGFKGR